MPPTPPRRLWKRLLPVAAALVVLAVGAERLVSRRLASSLLRRFEVEGSRRLGVAVSVDQVGLNLLRGRLDLSGLKIDNPEGFSSVGLLDLDALSISIDPLSIRSDTIVVREIRIRAPRFSYEIADGKRNIDSIIQRVQGVERSEAERPFDIEGEHVPTAPSQRPAMRRRTVKRSDATTRPPRRIIVDRFVLEEAQVAFSTRVTGSFRPTFPLPTVELHGLGRPEGLAPEEIAHLIGAEIVGAITKKAGMTSLPE